MARSRQTSQFFVVLENNNRTSIYQHLTTQELGLFALTSKTALNDVRKNASSILHARALHHAAFAEPVSSRVPEVTRLAVFNILKLHPELLFEEGYVKDPAGHQIYGSVYKIFLGADDIWALWILHKEIIPRITNGEAIAKAQYEQQFPRHAEGIIYDKRNDTQIANIKESLIEIVAVISDDECTEGKTTEPTTIAALNRLREHLSPKEGELIKSGLHSPRELLKMMYETYHANFKLWTIDQRRLYSSTVIGSGETVAAAVDAQRYKKGLSGSCDIGFLPDRTQSYYPPSGGVPENLGKVSFIDVFFSGNETNAPAVDMLNPIVSNDFPFFRNHVGQMSQCFEEINESLPRTCVRVVV